MFQTRFLRVHGKLIIDDLEGLVVEREKIVCFEEDPFSVSAGLSIDPCAKLLCREQS